jgi:hypothetical protein
MPTRLVLKEQYITPDEYLELLTIHFKSLPSDQLYLPVLTFTSCDKDNNETVYSMVRKMKSQKFLQFLLNKKSTINASP